MKWSAGWGSACDRCARAKTRCIRPESDSHAKCNRCQSLDVSCEQQVRKPRKKRRRKDVQSVTDAVLSNAGGGISNPHSGVTLRQRRPLAVGASSLPQQDHDSHGREQQEEEDDEPNIYVASVKAERSGVFNVSTWLPGYYPFPSPTCTCLGDSEGENDQEPAESDDALLSIYRTRLSPQFPFVAVPNDITAGELQKSRPFLAKAVKTVALVRNRRSMWKHGDLLLQHFSNSIFTRPDRSLDLLQGIIVFLGFYHYFCFAHGHFNNLIHLASSLIADMRLDRPRARPPQRKKHPQGMNPEEPRAMLNDERRAILAVWYLNSCNAVVLKKVNSPSRHFTEHMERQLRELQENLEYDTDAALAQMIYGQRANDMIAQLQLSDQSVDMQPSLDVWATRLDSLLAELESLRVRENQRKAHRYLVSSHQNYAMLQLMEPHLLGFGCSKQYEAAISTLSRTPDYFRSLAGNRNDAADAALREWFETWLSIPVCHLFYMSMSGIKQLMGTTVILLRRARLKLLARYRLGDADPAQNQDDPLAVPGSNPDDLMLDLLERLASRFEEAKVEMAAALCSEWSNDFFDLVAWKLRERKACIEKWTQVIADEAHHHGAREGAEGPGEVERPMFEPIWNEVNDVNGFGDIDAPGMWLDPLEEMLLSGQAFESWVQ